MAKALAKVTGDLQAPRGPDVEYRIEVKSSWGGRAVDLRLPRNLNCASCQGGGCDRCDRSGAISLRARDERSTSVRVRLPIEIRGDRDVCLRIPEAGGRSEVETEGRGHLLLRVSVGLTPSQCVRLAPLSGRTPDDEERLVLAKRSLIMAVALIALFFGMLKLSGWI